MLEVVVFYDVITMMYVSGIKNNYQSRFRYCYDPNYALMFDPDSRYDLIKKRLELACGKKLLVMKHKIPTE